MEIRKLLVANRGEIAVRIFRACTAEGIATVAVVAPDDKGSLHAREADEVVEIASYLYSEEHIRAAKQTGADAIHPGYGFLAENADFAEAVEAAGLVFVGPTPDALRRGGDKLEAKRAATSAGIPVLPDRRSRRDRLSTDDQGGRRRWRPRDARRSRVPGAPRRRRRGAPRGQGGIWRRDRLLRALPRASSTCGDPAARRRARARLLARRARLLDPAAASEGAGGGAVAGGRHRAARANGRRGDRVRARDRLSEPRHGRVPARRRRLLLPRAERRGSRSSIPSPRRRRGSIWSRCSSPSPAASSSPIRDRTLPPPCGRGAALRRRPAGLPAADRNGRAAATSRSRFASTPALPRATR